MRATRAVALVLLLVAVAAASWWFLGRHNNGPESVVVYYAKAADGTTLVPWTVSLGPARDPRSVAFYAAVQAVAGPAAGVDAVRFPPGTTVRSADVEGSTVDVDLSKDVGTDVEGSFREAAEFKALVYTLTALPGISSVRVSVAGEHVATLPGGHLELDEPLTRQSF
ncbi:MAG TPA: GerMN domain-containing protein [Candidatus Lustribacter sp.]|jgi:spore germination protein GerM|nr:GerMN domain-containing protein [Candidatus Lustribacter sp.]